MITRLIAAIVGLLAFAGCIVGGMVAGNEFDAIIIRAIKGLFLGCCVGWMAGKCCEIIVNDNFRELVRNDAAEEIAQARRQEAEEIEAEVVETHVASTDPQSSGPDGSEGWEKADSEENVSEDDHENDREHLNVPDVQETFAARAARELLGDVFRK